MFKSDVVTDAKCKIRIIIIFFIFKLITSVLSFNVIFVNNLQIAAFCCF